MLGDIGGGDSEEREARSAEARGRVGWWISGDGGDGGMGGTPARPNTALPDSVFRWGMGQKKIMACCHDSCVLCNQT